MTKDLHDIHIETTLPKSWEMAETFTAAVLSEDDISDSKVLDIWKDLTPVLIFTRGGRGAELHYEGRWNHIDAFPVTEIDPTGAGGRRS